MGTASTVVGGRNFTISSFMSVDKLAFANMSCENNVQTLDACSYAFYTRDISDNPTAQNNPPANLYGLVNVEIPGAPTRNTSVFQLLLGDLIAGNVSCSVSKPYDPANGNCTAATYNDVTSELTANVNLDGNAASISLNFSNPANITAALNFNDESFGGTGQAINAQSKARIFTQRSHKAYDYSVFSMTNVNPNFGKAVLYGAIATPIVLWDNSVPSQNYVDKYNSFIQSDINDGIPQATAALVSINTSSARTLYRAGNMLVQLSDYAGDATATQAFEFSYDGAGTAGLFNSVGIPPKRDQVSIGGNDILGTSDQASPTVIGNGPYTIKWANTVASPSNSRVQIRFRNVVNSNNDHVKHSEIRTIRMTPGQQGLSYDSANNEWSWTTTPEYNLLPGEIVKIQIRVTNTNGSLRGLSQGIFVNDGSLL